MVRASIRSFALGWLALGQLALGQGISAAQTRATAGPETFVTITPVFHQLVAYSLPGNFILDAPEHSNGKSYLRETVLRGESPERWTQMITLTGARGAATAGMTAPRMTENLAGSYKKSCPQTFASKSLGATQISGRPATLAVVSCGQVADEGGAAGAVHSETALLVTIAGTEDMYTVQWAERGPASAAPLTLDAAKWQDRFRTLSPLRVCAQVAGEKAPYPSCLRK